MDCPENVKFKLVDKVIDAFKERSNAEPFSVIDIDGARVEWEDGWGLVRCSNTQPILVLRFEAKTQERLQEIQVDANKPPPEPHPLLRLVELNPPL